MAAPAFGASGTATAGGTRATTALDVPTGVVADSVVIAVVYTDTGAIVVTPPAGWAHAEGSPVAASDHRMHVLWHRASGAESTAGTYDFTHSSTYTEGQAHRYDGAIATGTPFDSPTATGTVGAGAGSSSSPSVTITTADVDRLLLHAVSNWTGGTFTPSTGFTKRQQISPDNLATLSDKSQAAAGSSGAVVATCTGGGRTTAWLGGLIPAGAAATATPRGPLVVSPAVHRAIW